MSTDSTELMMEIIEYCKKRNYLLPDVWEGMAWVSTEIGEVYEVLLSTKPWVRNNPDSKPKFSREHLAEELGDVIFMIMLTGHAAGVNPLDAMQEKMTNKLKLVELEKQYKIARGVSSVVPITDEEAEKIFNEIADQEEERRED
jgi:NTP pyrophosphatase (non-canonical NTP hydrolase)